MLRFKLFGINYTVSFISVAFLTLSVFLSGQETNLVICVLCALFHETGHILFIVKYCGIPSEIAIKPMDVKISCDMSSLSFRQELTVNIAGPLMNLLMFTVFFALKFYFPLSIIDSISKASLILGVFNLLPMKSLDGGEILTLLLSKKFTLKVTDRIISVISVVILCPIATLGFMVLFASKFNYSLLVFAIYIILTLIL